MADLIPDVSQLFIMLCALGIVPVIVIWLAILIIRPLLESLGWFVGGYGSD